MNDNAKKWVEALRSGKYKQGKNVLRYKDKFCCLGVACDIYDKDIWNQLSSRAVSLPNYVMDWLGLATDEGRYYLGFLSGDNDCYNKTFAEIADIIESEPRGLFINASS